MEGKISEEDFVIKAIKNLRKPPYKGIHSVYSGFNQAFREYFSADPIPVTNRMADKGMIIIRPVKRGVMLYLPEESPPRPDTQNVLKKILGEEGGD